MAATTKHAKVELTIHRAEGLLALNPGNSSNPYIAVCVGAQTAVTPVQSKTVNPVFDATFTFVDCILPTIVTLRAFNKLPFADVEDSLGTATLTLFSTCPATKKVVELTHGGDTNLAQRAAANGCGQLTVSYTVSEMPQEDAPAAAPTTQSSLPASQQGSQPQLPVPSLPSPSSSSTTLPSHMSLFGFGAATHATPPSQQSQTPQPIPVPLAHHMTGTAALPAPTLSAHQSPASTPSPSLNGSSVAAGASGSNGPQVIVPPPLVSASPMTSTPNAMLQRSPKIGLNASPSASIPNNSFLTPPSLAPAQAPTTMGYQMANSAAAPPSNVPVPLPTKATNVPAYTSYPVPGLRPLESPMQSATNVAAPVQLSGQETFFYANNDHSARANVSGVPASAPTPTQRPFVPQAAVPMPYLPQSNVPESFHEGAVTQSCHTPQQSAPTSASFAATSQAPRLVPQPLLVTPPHIEGVPVPTPTFNHASAPQTPPSASAELPASTAAPQFPAQSGSQTSSPAVRPSQGSFSQGSLRVAVAPRTQPLSSSTSTSRTTTPSINATRGPLSEFPSMAPGSASRSPYYRPADAPRHGVPPLMTETGAGMGRPRPRDQPVTAGVAPSMTTTGRDPARRKETGTGSRTPSGNRTHLTGAAAPSTASIGAAGAGAVADASSVYADATYLFENAASGRDLQIFRKVRQADPHLANGFLQCRDYAGRTLLHIAAWHGQLAVLEVLLAPTAATEGRLPMLDLRTVIAPNSGNTILHAAAYGGQAEVAQWLRYTHPTAGALLLDVRNQRGMTAAQCAKESGFDAVARLLMPQ